MIELICVEKSKHCLTHIQIKKNVRVLVKCPSSMTRSARPERNKPSGDRYGTHNDHKFQATLFQEYGAHDLVLASRYCITETTKTFTPRHAGAVPAQSRQCVEVPVWYGPHLER